MRPSVRTGVMAGAISIALVAGAFVVGALDHARRTDAPHEVIEASLAGATVPVTTEDLSGTIQSENPAGTFAPGTGNATVSESSAIDTGWSRTGWRTPDRVVAGLVEFNGSPTWLVSFQGGDTCMPVRGPATYPSGSSPCAGTIVNVLVDATSGDWTDTFSNGHLVPSGSATPAESLDQVLGISN